MDVHILGAGLAGLFCGYEMLKRGVTPNIYFSPAENHGASWASQGVVSSKGLNSPESDLFELKVTGQRYTRAKLSELLSHGIKFKMHDGVHEEFYSASEYSKICSRIYRNSFRGLYAVEISQSPASFSKSMGALFYPYDYWVDVQGLLLSMLRFLKASGVCFYEREADQGFVCKLLKEGKKVVVASGYHSINLLPDIKLRSEIRPVSGSTLRFLSDSNKCSLVAGAYSGHFTGSSGVLGSSAIKSVWNQDFNSKSFQELERAKDLLKLRGNDISECWLVSGTRCVAKDRLPLVGEVRGFFSGSLYLSTGFFKNGLQLIPICSEYLANVIFGVADQTLSEKLEINLCPN